jgi:hypothetical protein
MSARYRKGDMPSHPEITETRTGNWLVECPCGWHDNLGRYASLSIAKDHVRHHMRQCPVPRGRTKIGYETNAQHRYDQEAAR